MCSNGNLYQILTDNIFSCITFHAKGVKINNVGVCSENQVFNRNFGTCTSEDVAPCLGYTENPCQPNSNGFYRVWGSCTEHVFCRDGEQMSVHNCPTGMHFNPATRSCDVPSNLNPLCPWEE